jgi:hypothetical protein
MKNADDFTNLGPRERAVNLLSIFVRQCTWSRSAASKNENSEIIA